MLITLININFVKVDIGTSQTAGHLSCMDWAPLLPDVKGKRAVANYRRYCVCSLFLIRYHDVKV